MTDREALQEIWEILYKKFGEWDPGTVPPWEPQGKEADMENEWSSDEIGYVAETMMAWAKNNGVPTPE